MLSKIYFFIMKSLLCLCIFLGLGIFCKLDSKNKELVYKKLYQEQIDFSRAKVFYDKYLGGVFPLEGLSSGTKAVFNEGLVYKNKLKYLDGVMLEVDYNYLVPTLESGIVIYIGKKDLYGNVVIVEGDNDIDIWYGNVCNEMVKIYDRVSKGDYLGEVCDNKLFIAYTKKNEFLNYEDYLD